MLMVMLRSICIVALPNSEIVVAVVVGLLLLLSLFVAVAVAVLLWRYWRCCCCSGGGNGDGGVVRNCPFSGRSHPIFSTHLSRISFWLDTNQPLAEGIANLSKYVCVVPAHTHTLSSPYPPRTEHVSAHGVNDKSNHPPSRARGRR